MAFWSCRAGHAKIRVLGGGHNDRIAPHQAHLIGIARPIRRGNDGFVSVFDQRDDGVKNGLLGAAGDNDLRRGIAQPIVALNLSQIACLSSGMPDAGLV